MNEVMRQEKKYLIHLADMARLSGALSQVMVQDRHGGVLGYRIRSLYFDTLNDADFFEKVEGAELRRKIRLRIYDPGADFAMLEMKQKQGAYQRKRSLRMHREDALQLTAEPHNALQLTAGHYEALLRYEEPFAAECYGLMSRMCYRPKAIVEYQRKAFIAKENRIRITLDHHIIATESRLDLFAPDLNLYPVLDPFSAVLEVKYNGFLLSYIKAAVNGADRSELSVSKYCLARSAGLHYQM